MCRSCQNVWHHSQHLAYPDLHSIDYHELRRKVAVFKGVTATRKNVFLTFLTTHGITPNAYAKELVPVELAIECLFEEES